MASCTSLYTCEELIEKLKDLDSSMDDAVTRSKLDTGQSNHEISQSLAQMQRQYEKYKTLLKRQCPTCYHNIFGPSLVKFREPQC